MSDTPHYTQIKLDIDAPERLTAAEVVRQARVGWRVAKHNGQPNVFVLVAAAKLEPGKPIYVGASAKTSPVGVAAACAVLLQGRIDGHAPKDVDRRFVYALNLLRDYLRETTGGAT